MAVAFVTHPHCHLHRWATITPSARHGSARSRTHCTRAGSTTCCSTTRPRAPRSSSSRACTRAPTSRTWRSRTRDRARAHRPRHLDVPRHFRGRIAGGRSERARDGPGARRARCARVLQRAAPGPSRGTHDRHGFLLLQQRRRGGTPCAGPARARAGRDPRLRRAPRQWHRRHLRRRPARAALLVVPVSTVAGPEPADAAGARRQLPVAARQRQRRVPRGRRGALVAGARGVRAATGADFRGLRRARRGRHVAPATHARRITPGSRKSPAASPIATRRAASSRRSKAATTCGRLPRAP